MAMPADEDSDEAEATPPLLAKATFVRTPPGVGVVVGVELGVGVAVGVAVGATVGVVVGVGVTVGVEFGVGVGVDVTLPPLQVSSSTMRL